MTDIVYVFNVYETAPAESSSSDGGIVVVQVPASEAFTRFVQVGS
jgi:hypothetical protein